MLTYDEVANHEDRKDPKGTIRLFLRVLNQLAMNKDEAMEMIPIFFPKNQLNESGTTRSGFALRSSDSYLVEQLLQKPNVVPSYLGGTPDNEYTPSGELEPVFIEGRPTVISEKEAKIFIRSGGKDNPTPVGLKRNKHGIWKIFNWSSIATGVKPPASTADDF